MWVVIPTLKGYEPALKLLKQSMGGPHTTIITVYQNEDADGYTKTDEGFVVTLRRNIYEYGAWIGVQLLVDAGQLTGDEWFLMMHDTCRFTEETIPKLINLEFILEKTPVELYFLVGCRFHSICLARRNGISILANYFKDTHSMTKEEACKLECNLPVEGIVTGEHLLRPCNVPEKVDVYGDGKLRNISVLESIKLVKFYA